MPQTRSAAAAAAAAAAASEATAAAYTVATTAEAFEAGLVRLVRSHHIHTVELLSAMEQTHVGAATSRASPLPVLIVVEARLTSTLAWQPGSRSWPHCNEPSKGDDSVFTYHVSFLSPTDAAPVSVHAFPTNFPSTTLSAEWCAQLQRQLAVCSALTGLPTRLSVSLLPYVPHLTWERGRDGLLGATHSATMMSSPLETGDVAAEQLVRVAVLLNANIPLGPRAGRNTAVLLLHAADGAICSVATSMPITAEERKKRPRQSTPKRGELETDSIMDKEPFFRLLSRHSETHILPKISWEAVWSRPMQLEGDGCRDVCGLREQLGYSFYLQGALDARRAQSITLILDAPLEMWRRVLHSDALLVPNRENGSLQGFPECVAKTAAGALSRLAAENIDCFVRHSLTTPSGSGEVRGGEGEEAADASASAEAVPISLQHSWSLLVQSIADSLAQIVRTSRNRVFVAEVHRLLLNRQAAKKTLPPCCDAGDDPDIDAETSAAACSPPPLAKTVALLRWAVETRLMEP
ncbi:uncharacterized protein Tco025E_02471 [Trypanosoma conorhini]|uniref:Uncharacterized protein n=1 Tax=Trypanosoma conorhini TaxID=83891 RepID=A0A3R7N324_9TRYP|nr:uncharacterized protein Tco025E_02471 [Trypanosoma conorhini]RNF24644.1 hypothetical protein Tco025E_02471 [Trypanosoma conorhini]